MQINVLYWKKIKKGSLYAFSLSRSSVFGGLGFGWLFWCSLGGVAALLSLFLWLCGGLPLLLSVCGFGFLCCCLRSVGLPLLRGALSVVLGALLSPSAGGAAGSLAPALGSALRSAAPPGWAASGCGCCSGWGSPRGLLWLSLSWGCFSGGFGCLRALGSGGCGCGLRCGCGLGGAGLLPFCFGFFGGFWRLGLWAVCFRSALCCGGGCGGCWWALVLLPRWALPFWLGSWLSLALCFWLWLLGLSGFGCWLWLGLLGFLSLGGSCWLGLSLSWWGLVVAACCNAAFASVKLGGAKPPLFLL